MDETKTGPATRPERSPKGTGGAQGNDQGDDQRRELRAPIVLRVDYEGPDELVFDYTENLSSRGIFLKTSRAFQVGDRIRLMLSFPGLLEALGIEGTVRWMREGDDTGVGVEFDQGEARATVEALIDRVRQRDPKLVSRLIRVLVVEDNPHVARLIRAGMLGSSERYFGHRLAFNFRTAANGREAIDLLENEPFDALIVDIYLPILDGANVIAHVRASQALRHLPVIAVSAGGDSAQEAALAAGADFFLPKPMRLRQILETMARLLDLGQDGAAIPLR
jgi:uncharacterized protein (TIGR02266 family)